MLRQRQTNPHDQIEAQIHAAGNVGALERLAGIGPAHEERAAFWQPFSHLAGATSLDAGVAELKRRIRARADE